ARAQVRAAEIAASLAILEQVIDSLPAGPADSPPASGRLPSQRVGVGVVEAWRGELIHWVTTDGDGRIERYAIKDPSFNNWTGRAAPSPSTAAAALAAAPAWPPAPQEPLSRTARHARQPPPATRWCSPTGNLRLRIADCGLRIIRTPASGPPIRNPQSAIRNR